MLIISLLLLHFSQVLLHFIIKAYQQVLLLALVIMSRSIRILIEASDPPEAPVNVESNMLVILAASICTAVCVIGLIGMARCAWLRRGIIISSSGGGTAAINKTINKGLNKKILRTFPKFTYATSSDLPKFASSDCAICLSEFTEGEEIRVLPGCGHGFHAACIDTWLASHSSCPSCRNKCCQSPSPGAATATAAAAAGDGSIDSNKNVQASTSMC